MNIKNLKVITVNGLLHNANTFTSPIHLTFVPQYMKVKSLVSSIDITDDNQGSATAILLNNLLLIKSSLVNYEVLGSIVTAENYTIITDVGGDTSRVFSCINNTDTLFKLHNQVINGNFDFQVTNLIGEVPYFIATNANNFSLSLIIQLEFIEYQ
jgi:hypothetical protein